MDFERYTSRPLVVCTKKIIFLFLNQNIVTGTQKNHLNKAPKTYVKTDC